MILSIVVPVFNGAPYIEECLESILCELSGSEWKDEIEVVVVDDGSTDNTKDVLLTYTKKGVSVVRQDHQGVLAARAKGLTISKGEWIWFVDSDDLIPCGALKNVIGACAGAASQLIKFRYARLDCGGVTPEKSIEIRQKIVDVHKIFNESSDTPLQTIGMCIGDKIYRRDSVMSAFSDIQGCGLSIGEDGLMALAVLIHSTRVSYLEEVIYYYRQRLESVSHRYDEECVSKRQSFVERLHALLVASKKYEIERVDRIRAFHAYEAVIMVIRDSLRSDISWLKAVRLVRKLRASKLPDWARIYLHSSLKRRLIGLLIAFPNIVLITRAVRRMI